MKSTKKTKAKAVKTKGVKITASGLKAATERLVKAGGWNTPADYLRDLSKELGLL
jgi:hypothetical protein